MKKLLIALGILTLAGCSTTVQTPNTVSGVKPLQTAPLATLTPATPVMPDLTPAQAICTNLRSQLQTQLPFQVQSQLRWQTVAIHNPLQTNVNGALVPACRISWRTSGFTIEKFGLAPNFMSAALDRLAWTSNAQTNAYAADSAVGHQEALVNGNQLALLNYSFAPPAGKCPTNIPISACKFSQKKWIYEMQLWVLAQ